MLSKNLNILVTGASGFLGQYVVSQALHRGHQVRAISRSVDHSLWNNHDRLTIVSGDLLNQESMGGYLEGIDVVIHLAASKTGDWNTQLAGTVKITENLLAGMLSARVKRLVGISSFSVFDYFNAKQGSTIDERSSLESNPAKRDTYAQMKLKQEKLFQEFQNNHEGQVTILRPGMIYGKDNLWSARLGFNKVDKIWLLIDSGAELPLIYVENCAEAIVLASESKTSINQIINLVDDDSVIQSDYVNQILPYLKIKPTIIKINWLFIDLMSSLAAKINRLLFNEKKILPEVLSPPSLHARFKPLKYTNALAKKLLNWQPQYCLKTALARINELSN